MPDRIATLTHAASVARLLRLQRFPESVKRAPVAGIARPGPRGRSPRPRWRRRSAGALLPRSRAPDSTSQRARRNSVGLAARWLCDSAPRRGQVAIQGRNLAVKNLDRDRAAPAWQDSVRRARPPAVCPPCAAVPSRSAVRSLAIVPGGIGQPARIMPRRGVDRSAPASGIGCFRISSHRAKRASMNGCQVRKPSNIAICFTPGATCSAIWFALSIAQAEFPCMLHAVARKCRL